MIPYSTREDEVLSSFETDPVSGLTAEQALNRLEKNGENALRERKKKSLFKRFLSQFKDAMIIILIIAAAVSFGIAIYEGNAREFFEPALILLIVIINAVIGVMQESKAEKALDALKKLSAPHARCLRDGTEAVIDAAKLVTGDIVMLEAGDFVPADARLLSSNSLKCEESALTGESVPSEKDAKALPAENAPLGDRVNMVYSGCSVTYGTARAVVTATGMNTEMGKIAGLLEGASEVQTPLQQKLAKLGKYLGFIALAACAVIFVVGIINKIDVLEIFMTSVSLAVSA
ncbi:MAG TPA: HAD-IC family P-type ATPase, partial [Bacillota bacterium]|nr:HAD-IC family P-type ATPase [Bacillota bacterium]